MVSSYIILENVPYQKDIHKKYQITDNLLPVHFKIKRRTKTSMQLVIYFLF